MTDGFIYRMPCLSKYRFNHKGECQNVKTGGMVVLTCRENTHPRYQLIDDNEKYASVSLPEVTQYIKHLKAEMEYNPFAFHHYVIYRPTIKVMNRYRKGEY